jgi:glycosyltransferase involved in cell wall biosynthesis
MAKLSIVVPVHNEEETIPLFTAVLTEVLQELQSIQIELIFVNDGSSDRTLEVLRGLRVNAWTVVIVDLSRNFGKEAALTAGLSESTGDATIVIDVDLQDPPSLIPDMVRAWQGGAKVVLAQRDKRSTDSKIKRNTAKYFYKVHNYLSAVKLPENVGDFRLMDAQVVKEVLKLQESNRFMKGIFAWVGFSASLVNYDRPARAAGKTSFNLRRLWNFAIEGITSFSIAPLKVFGFIGLGISFSGFLYACFLVLRVSFQGSDVPGYSSLMVAMLILTGIQLIGIGILGEYIGRIYIESKGRPTYVIRSIYGRD